MFTVFVATRDKKDVEQTIQPADDTELNSTDGGEATRDSSIAEVLEIANASLENMAQSLHDYTATFVKQDCDKSGTLNEPSKMQVKIQTRMRNETNDAPKRIYLKFLAPEATAGREVIWGADLYDGNLQVHDTSILLSWKTLSLPPEGMLAMQGQRFPIYEIGLVRLVEQLIERGTADANNPDVSVTITRGHMVDDLETELIRVKRPKPSEREDDFSLAEVIYDPERLLIISYRSFGWPENGSDELPLLESYEYQDLKTNVGLTDSDFDVENESYAYP